jgi:hypothetical protein
MRTVRETLKTKGDSCTIVKKGRKYLGVKNNEFFLIGRPEGAIAFSNEEEATSLISTLIIDDRNAKVIGKKYDLVPLSLR